jgi:NADH-quinone oxidoreductase subunit L
VIHALHGEQDIRNMGGLRKLLPITYSTFFIASLAIAGFPLLAGFFSKDEILYETFHEGHTILWVIGALTSLLTATYMFRLVFLTFHGERRHDAPSPGGHGHAPAHPEEEEPVAHGTSHGHAHGGHGHGHIHDAPPAMALALVVLAIGSIAAGYIGIPHALGGHNVLAAWLEPAFEAPPEAGAAAADVATPTGEPGPVAAGETGEAAAAADEALELTLMGVSSAIAVLGIGIAAVIWLMRRDLAASMARSFAPLHRLLLNKYYVDEVYDAAIVKPIHVLSREGLWRGFDVRVVDGAVNGAATIVAASAAVLRRLQTGSVLAYAGSLFIGVVAVLGYYLWR